AAGRAAGRAPPRAGGADPAPRRLHRPRSARSAGGGGAVAGGGGQQRSAGPRAALRATPGARGGGRADRDGARRWPVRHNRRPQHVRLRGRAGRRDLLRAQPPAAVRAARGAVAPQPGLAHRQAHPAPLLLRDPPHRGRPRHAPARVLRSEGCAAATLTPSHAHATVPSGMPRIVAHVDMDAFYAAVEARRDPALRDRPLVVGADPKEGHGRGVVTAASYATRRYGIRSALPISRAWRLAEAARRRGEPETIFVRDDHALYRAVSERIMAIIEAAGDAFQKTSVDEAYLELSSLGDFEAATERARQLKAEIAAREGLTASVGIGPNKLVAKIASDFDKPDGLTVVRP